MKKILVYVLSIMILISVSSCDSKINKKPVKSKTNKSKVVESNKIVAENKSKEVSKKKEAKEVIQKEEPKEEKKVNKKIVVIDPGHAAGGNKGKEKQSPDLEIMKIKDPGGAQGVSTRVPEYVINMKVALKLKKLLEQKQITVIMTKTGDEEDPGNIERAKVGNDNNASLVIRLHCDSAQSKSAHGATMLTPSKIGYAKKISGISRKYGQTILNGLVAECGMYNRGIVERKDLTGFNWSKIPVVLIEMGFMSNPKEDNLLNDDNYQNKLAKGLCKGILDALK